MSLGCCPDFCSWPLALCADQHGGEEIMSVWQQSTVHLKTSWLNAQKYSWFYKIWIWDKKTRDIKGGRLGEFSRRLSSTKEQLWLWVSSRWLRKAWNCQFYSIYFSTFNVFLFEVLYVPDFQKYSKTARIGLQPRPFRLLQENDVLWVCHCRFANVAFQPNQDPRKSC